MPTKWPLPLDMMLLVLLLLLPVIMLTLIIFVPQCTHLLPRDLPAQDSDLEPVLLADSQDITEQSAQTGVSEKVPEIPSYCPTISIGSEQRSLTGDGDSSPVDQIITNFEFEECESNRDFAVRTLKENFQFWSFVLKANDFILQAIRKIPFLSLPDSFCIPNRGSAFLYKDFVSDAIEELSGVVALSN